MPRQKSPAHDWCFTINNPRRRDHQRVQDWQYNYLIYQLEVGDQGTPHLQGFVQFTTKQRLTALKKLHKSAHWEPRRGSAYQASHYCEKPVPDCDCHHCVDTPRVYPQFIFKNGNISAPAGEKLTSIARVIKTKGLSAAIDNYPTHYMGMNRGMVNRPPINYKEALANFYSPQRDWQTVVSVCYGKPETGKTRYAMLAPSPYKLAAFGAEGSTDFFGDYRPDQHETLVVDDFYSNWKYTTFLQVCDRYPTEVHTKGGFRQLLVRHIVFTSNHSPGVWYPNVLADADRRESFNRRIHNIIWFTPDGYWVKKGTLPWPCPFLQPLAWNHVLRNEMLPIALLPQSQNLTIHERGILDPSQLFV